MIEACEPRPNDVDRLLRALPEWFGIEDSIREYVDAARRLPTLIALDPGRQPIGVLLFERHFPTAVEVYLMAIDRSWHRQGVGRALINAMESIVRHDGTKLLSVKTLGPSRPDPNYAQTRQFYLSCGFLPLEALHDLWPENPCLMMVKPLTP